MEDTNKMSATDIAQVTTRVYALLQPLEAEERARVLGAVRALFGDANPSGSKGGGLQGSDSPQDGAYPVPAARWLSQNGISQAQIENVVHVSDGSVDLIVGEIPGASKKEQTMNCYLFSGLRELFSSGIPKFSEEQAVALCQRMGCFDRSNHSSHRKTFGNLIAGTKNAGYSLSAPGLRMVAELVKELSPA